MGTHASAKFGYGIVLRGEEHEFLTGVIGWEEEYCRRKGLDWSHESYWKEHKKLIEDCPTDCQMYGCDGFFNYLLVAKESHKTAWDYGTEPVGDIIRGGSSLQLDIWRTQIKEFCEFMDLPFVEPDWHIAAVYF
jgi:hypothetical protein